MALHFTREELAERRAAAVRLMQQRGLDAMLIFRQESMYYLTGYDTFGYVFFQCLFLGADGRMTLLTRAPDRLQAKLTSVIEDVRIWVDAPDAAPALPAEVREGSVGALLGQVLKVLLELYAEGERLFGAGARLFEGVGHELHGLELVRNVAARPLVRPRGFGAAGPPGRAGVPRGGSEPAHRRGGQRRRHVRGRDRPQPVLLPRCRGCCPMGGAGGRGGLVYPARCVRQRADP